MARARTRTPEPTAGLFRKHRTPASPRRGPGSADVDALVSSCSTVAIKTRQDTLAETVRLSARPVHLAVAGFGENDRSRQAPSLPNHVAWVLGHCALTMHRVAERLDGGPLPEGDFSTGDGATGDAERYHTESVCFASGADGDPDRYPSLGRCRAIFDAAIERLAEAAATATDEALDAPTGWGVEGETLPVDVLVQRVAIHNGVHSGQLLDLRRALGLPSIFQSG